MTSVTYHLLDVFTDTQFEGNPLAVVIDPPELSDELMQSIAREFNLSETIFLDATSPGTWATRIFTPAGELPFAGHPTVGAAVALGTTGRVERPDSQSGAPGHADIVLAERAGPVPVRIDFDGNGVAVAATFVAPKPPELVASVEADVTSRLVDALHLDQADLAPGADVGVWSAGVPFTIVPLASIDALGRARLDVGRFAPLDGAVEPFLYLIAPGAGAGDWRARMFAPIAGVAEDPATGSAACALAGYLASSVPDGDAAWTVEQGVEMGRRSVLELSATVADGAAVEARLSGAAVVVAEGQLRLG